jgi:hypothetical protein
MLQDGCDFSIARAGVEQGHFEAHNLQVSPPAEASRPLSCGRLKDNAKSLDAIIGAYQKTPNRGLGKRSTDRLDTRKRGLLCAAIAKTLASVHTNRERQKKI